MLRNSTRALIAALFIALLPAAAQAVCNPTQSPPGSIGCQPALSTPQPTDLVMSWRPSLFPNSSGTFTIAQMSAYFATASGFITGPISSTVGHLAVWGDTTGTSLTDLATPLSVALGGTGAATLTNHGVIIGSGTSALAATAVGTNGQMLLGATGANPGWNTMSGDATLGTSGALTMATVNGNVGSFGTTLATGTFTVNAKGLVTAASNTTIATVTSGAAGVAPATGGGTVNFLRADASWASPVGTTSGALKANGSGVVSQAACTDLSNGATGCSTATGTSGATIPLLSGRNSWSAGQAGVPVTVSISTATFTPNHALANNFNITLINASCPCTLANPTNIVAGQSGLIVINQSATGSDLITSYGGFYKWPGGTTPTLSTGASAIDIFSYYVIDATHIAMLAQTNFQ